MKKEEIKGLLVSYVANEKIDWDNIPNEDDVRYTCHEYEEELEALPDDNWEAEDERLMEKYSSKIKAIIAQLK